MMIFSNCGFKRTLALMTVSLFILVMAATVQASDYVSVIKDGVNVRSGPGTNYEVLYELPQGYPLKVLARQGEWFKVIDYESDRGWVYSSLVTSSPYIIVKVEEANVRSGPGTQYKKVGSVSRDVIMQKVGSQGGWVKVSHPQLTGWIYKNLIWP